MTLPETAILGFLAGNSMAELGRQQDMVVFFACLDRLTKSTLSETGRFVLLDRLFKRYLREEDLDEAVLSMNIARKQFQLAMVDGTYLISLGVDKDHTLLDLDEKSLGEVFINYFKAFFKCIES